MATGTLINFVIVSLSLFPSALASATSPQSLGSDLSIVTHNDLYGNTTSRTAATVALDTRYIYSAATSRCAALGTVLWNPDSYKQDLGFLQYLEQSNTTDEVGTYWIKGNATHHCRAITTRGEQRIYPCSTQLPALCSNSATDTVRQITVSTNNASFIGYRDRQAFRFLGIKYASIPARFSHSTYFQPTSNTTALAYGPQCFQASCGKSTTTCSEDCLSLNIWTPYLPNGEGAPSKKKAVMVWIHGGSFTSGTGRDPTFDSSALASRGDVVAVTINYRLSTLGFLALENTPLTGNYGLQDQNVALDWIRAHIGDFGGDKDKITIFGQSAGAASVRALLASPQSKAKIAGAILQSTPQGYTASPYAEYLSLAEVTNRTKAILGETGCSGMDEDVQACLRKVDPLVLVGYRNATHGFTGTVAANPVIDGSFLTTSLLLGPSAPKLNIPILQGTVRDDGSPFTTYSSTPNVSQALTAQGFPANAILSSGAFPLPQNANNTLSIFNLTSRVATNAFFRCAGQSTAHLAAKNGVFKKVYTYEFDRAYQIPDWSPNPPACEAPVTPGHPFGDPDAPFYKCHSGELTSVFGTTLRLGQPQRDAKDIPFSQYIVDTWTAFARRGNPTPDTKFLAARGFVNTTKYVEDAGEWKTVDKTNTPVRVLDTKVRDEPWREEKQCDVLGVPLNYYER